MDQRTRSVIDRAWNALANDLRAADSLITLIDSFPGLLLLTKNISEEARYIAVSQGWEALVGWTPTEIKKMGLLGLSIPEDLAQLAEFKDRLISGPWQGIRYRWRKKGGGAVLFEWEGTRYSGSGNILCGAKVIPT